MAETFGEPTPEAVVAELEQRFGPGFSNGVAAILLHDSLPETFGREAWSEWFFKPADAAFELARELGIIQPFKSDQWKMTPLGSQVATIVREKTLL